MNIMNDFLLFLISWAIGWLIYSIVCYIYDVYIDKNNTSKKLLIYNAFKNGILSWFGIMVIIIFAFIMLLVKIDEKISNKLK